MQWRKIVFSVNFAITMGTDQARQEEGRGRKEGRAAGRKRVRRKKTEPKPYTLCKHLL